MPDPAFNTASTVHNRPRAEVQIHFSVAERFPMMSKESAPVAWSALMYELEDAQEHLTSIIANMNSDANFDEVNLRIDLGHVFSHLNRAWHRREKIEGLDEVEWLEASKFPTDLDPT